MAMVTSHHHVDHVGRIFMVNRLAQVVQTAIVIAGNGAFSSGGVFNYLKAILGDAQCCALFVGC